MFGTSHVHRPTHIYSVALAALSILCAVGAARAQSSTGSSTTTGVSRAFNPAISLNGLFLGFAQPGFVAQDHQPAAARQENEDVDAEPVHSHGALEEGMSIQEIELRFTSTIDPYSKADATFAYHDGAIELEEGYIVSSILPWGLGLRAGRFLVPLGAENQLHTHQLPFVRRSLIGSALFDENLSDVGVELRWLSPLPFFAELRGAVFDGGHASYFDSEAGEDLSYLAGLGVLWELGESSTVQMDGSGLTGLNGFGESTASTLASVSAVYRWKPTRTRVYRSFKLGAEYIYADRDATDPADAFFNGGWYVHGSYQMSRRWWIQGRYGMADRSFDHELEAYVDDGSERVSVIAAFVPSEFQALRLEFSSISTPDDDYSELFLQYNFTIGSHPAHVY